MNKVLILGGTSTSHEIIKTIEGDFIISVATNYGYEIFSKKYDNKVVHQKFNEESLKKFIKENKINKIIDTTHPYATEISELAKNVSKQLAIFYENKVRKIKDKIKYSNAYLFETYEEIVDFLEEKKYKSILFTIGSKNINKFKDFSEISYVRILPFENSIKLCVNAGFKYNKIIAIQGPFSENFNIALIKELKIDCLVTKNSGEGSGFKEKLSACIKTGIDITIKTL